MKLKPIFILAILAILGLIVHKTLFYFFVPKVFENNFIYPVSLLYLSFFGYSAGMILLLEKIKKVNIDSVGYTFLLVTSIKMVVAFLFLRPIIAEDLPKTTTEKISFFIIFIYFLTIETIVTIRILNNKQ
ncbi:hypothetical protein [Flavobacterium sp.]